jgi:hypothetical protein
MTNTTNDPNNSGNRAKRFVTSDLHPRVYAALIGLSLWFVVWIWSFFGAGVTDYLLFIVSGFTGVVIALWLIHDWVREDFDTETGPLSSAAGCDDYVPKPFSPRQLLAKIRQYLS